MRSYRRKSNDRTEEPEASDSSPAPAQPVSVGLDASTIMAFGKKVAEMPLLDTRSPQEILNGIAD